jgi:hypothetical protein
LILALFESNLRKWRGELKFQESKCHIRGILTLRLNDVGPLLSAIALWREFFSGAVC